MKRLLLLQLQWEERYSSIGKYQSLTGFLNQCRGLLHTSITVRNHGFWTFQSMSILLGLTCPFPERRFLSWEDLIRTLEGSENACYPMRKRSCFLRYRKKGIR